MNPLTNVKNINKLNEIELQKGLVDKKSWHDIYKGSAWVFIGGLAYGLTEGDILAVFSQYGEIVNLNLVRDKKTGKTKGFCFLCYANQKSTILAVDNLNGIKLCGRTIRVDHVSNYKPPKDNEHDDEITKHLKAEGCAPKAIKLETPSIPIEIEPKIKKKKLKKDKKKHKKSKKAEKEDELGSRKEIKKEKVDPGYEKYEYSNKNQLHRDKKKSKKNCQRESSDSESSSDSSDNLENSYRQRKELTFNKKEKNIQKPPGNSTNFKNPDRQYSRTKHSLNDYESDSSDESMKRKKLRFNQVGYKTIHEKHSYNKNRTEQSSSDESSVLNRASSSAKQNNGNYSSHRQQSFFENSHDSRSRSKTNRGKSERNRHDS